VAYLSFLLGIIAFLGLPAFLVSLEAIRDEWDNSLGSILHNFSPRVLIILVNGDGGGGVPVISKTIIFPHLAELNPVF
jgi:hypothetical protein